MTAEVIAMLVGAAFSAIFVAACRRVYGNYHSIDVFENPEKLSVSKLREIVAFARITIKNSDQGSGKNDEARAKLLAAMAELRRRQSIDPR